MPKPIDPVALLSAVAVTAKKAETYHAETHVIAIEELRQILFELQDNAPKKAKLRSPRYRNRPGIFGPYAPTFEQFPECMFVD